MSGILITKATMQKLEDKAKAGVVQLYEFFEC